MKMERVNVKMLLVVVVLVAAFAMQEVVSKEERSQMRKRQERRGEREEEQAAAVEEKRQRREIEQDEEEEYIRWERGMGRSEEEEEKEEEEEERREEEEEEEKEEEEEERREEEEEKSGKMFLLGEGERVVRSNAGEIRVVKGFGQGSAGSKNVGRAVHIGFIMMEPKSMFVPQYWDSDMVLYLSRGEAKIGLIYKDVLVEKSLRTGDLYRVQAGSAFYLLNTAEGHRLHIICSIDPSEESDELFRSFYIGGGLNPASVLAGFEPQTLSTAFNVSISKLKEIMTSQEGGPFVFTDSQSHGPAAATNSVWSGFHTLDLEKEDKLRKLKRLDLSLDDNYHEEDEDDEENNNGSNHEEYSWRSFVNRVLLGGGDQDDNKWESSKKGPAAFNLIEAKPDFKSNYGWTISVDKHRYSPLKKSNLGVYYVNLTAGSMLAPHINPTATEYGVVLRGSGTIQIVYPNGTSAINTRLNQGSVFRVPRYYPFCQIASRSGPFEFFGFSTSGKRNRPQFLVGTTSILKTMAGEEFAAAFGVTVDRFKEIVDGQREGVVIPTPGEKK